MNWMFSMKEIFPSFDDVWLSEQLVDMYYMNIYSYYLYQ